MEAQSIQSNVSLDPEKANSAPPSDQKEGSETEEYAVEQIVAKKIVNGQNLYLIKWKGYPDSHSTWEPVENLLNALDLVVEYEVRECLRDSNQDNHSPKGSPKHHKKHKDDQNHGGGNDPGSGKKENETDSKKKKSKKKRVIGELEPMEGGNQEEGVSQVTKKVKLSKSAVLGSGVKKEKNGMEIENGNINGEMNSAKKKRGRPPKKDQDMIEKIEIVEPTIKKRGRPAKLNSNKIQEGNKTIIQLKRTTGSKKTVQVDPKAARSNTVGKTINSEQPKKRGRPRKDMSSSVPLVLKEDIIVVNKEEKKRGRPRKVVEGIEEEKKEQKIENKREGSEKSKSIDGSPERKMKREKERKQNSKDQDEGDIRSNNDNKKPEKMLNEYESFKISLMNSSIVKRRGRPPKHSETGDKKRSNSGVGDSSVTNQVAILVGSESGEIGQSNKKDRKNVNSEDLKAKQKGRSANKTSLDEGEGQQKKRGRPPKDFSAKQAENKQNGIDRKDVKAEGKKRGRPPKKPQGKNEENNDDDYSNIDLKITLPNDIFKTSNVEEKDSEEGHQTSSEGEGENDKGKAGTGIELATDVGTSGNAVERKNASDSY